MKSILSFILSKLFIWMYRGQTHENQMLIVYVCLLVMILAKFVQLLNENFKVDSIQLCFGENYTAFGDSSVELEIVALFFVSDARHSSTNFGDWAYAARDGDHIAGNTTSIEIEDDDVVMTSYCTEVRAEVKMTRLQFVKLFDEWQEKVCENKPRELLIIHDNDEYFIKVTKQ